MKWKEVIRGQFEFQYNVAGKLIGMVHDDELNWKPPSGDNWMNMGQLLRHLDSACGSMVKGFVTNDWGLPADFDLESMTVEQMIMPLDTMLPVASVEDAKVRLAGDKKLAFEYFEKCSEEELTEKMVRMSALKIDMLLGSVMLLAANHLDHHKDQLYYYLKLQGKPVHSGHLFAM